MAEVYKINLTLLVFLLCLVGCNRSKQESGLEVDDSIENDFSSKVDSVGMDSDSISSEYFILKFPDKVVFEKFHRGDLEYHSNLDTISLSKEDRRYTYFYANTFDKELTIEELKKKPLDTFVMLENNWIPFKTKFNKLGTQRLDGYIEDKVILDNYYSNGNARIITYEVRVIKEVEVTDDKEYVPVNEVLRG
jgi:hypothetical protein